MSITDRHREQLDEILQHCSRPFLAQTLEISLSVINSHYRADARQPGAELLAKYCRVNSLREFQDVPRTRALLYDPLYTLTGQRSEIEASAGLVLKRIRRLLDDLEA